MNACSPRRFSSSHGGPAALLCSTGPTRSLPSLHCWLRCCDSGQSGGSGSSEENLSGTNFQQRTEETHTSRLERRGTVCMAYCRATLLVRLTLGLALCLAQRLSVSASDDPGSQDLRQDLRQRARGLLLSEGARAAATHGMTGTPVTAAGASVASAIGSAAASAVVATRRAGGVGWLNSSGGSKRRGTERGSNWSSSSTKSVGAGGGKGRRALSLLTPAVAPRAGTSALFIVSAASPAAAPPRARETYLSEVDRARCRCVSVCNL